MESNNLSRDELIYIEEKIRKEQEELVKEKSKLLEYSPIQYIFYQEEFDIYELYAKKKLSGTINEVSIDTCAKTVDRGIEVNPLIEYADKFTQIPDQFYQPSTCKNSIGLLSSQGTSIDNNLSQNQENKNKNSILELEYLTDIISLFLQNDKTMSNEENENEAQNSHITVNAVERLKRVVNAKQKALHWVKNDYNELLTLDQNIVLKIRKIFNLSNNQGFVCFIDVIKSSITPSNYKNENRIDNNVVKSSNKDGERYNKEIAEAKKSLLLSSLLEDVFAMEEDDSSNKKQNIKWRKLDQESEKLTVLVQLDFDGNIVAVYPNDQNIIDVCFIPKCISSRKGIIDLANYKVANCEYFLSDRQNQTDLEAIGAEIKTWDNIIGLSDNGTIIEFIPFFFKNKKEKSTPEEEVEDEAEINIWQPYKQIYHLQRSGMFENLKEISAKNASLMEFTPFINNTIINLMKEPIEELVKYSSIPVQYLCILILEKDMQTESLDSNNKENFKSIENNNNKSRKYQNLWVLLQTETKIYIDNIKVYEASLGKKTSKINNIIKLGEDKIIFECIGRQSFVVNTEFINQSNNKLASIETFLNKNNTVNTIGLFYKQFFDQLCNTLKTVFQQNIDSMFPNTMYKLENDLTNKIFFITSGEISIIKAKSIKVILTKTEYLLIDWIVFNTNIVKIYIIQQNKNKKENYLILAMLNYHGMKLDSIETKNQKISSDILKIIINETTIDIRNSF